VHQTEVRLEFLQVRQSTACDLHKSLKKVLAVADQQLSPMFVQYIRRNHLDINMITSEWYLFLPVVVNNI
jgi:hypothetical protein